MLTLSSSAIHTMGINKIDKPDIRLDSRCILDPIDLKPAGIFQGVLMKKFCIWVFMATAAVIFTIGCRSSNDVTLEVLNPRGEITLPPVSAPSARIADLAGKKIGLYWNEKPGGIHFWNGIEQLLKEKLPGTTVLRYSGAFDLGEEFAAKIAAETDAFFYGVGD
jgi:hypothetical protein